VLTHPIVTLIRRELLSAPRSRWFYLRRLGFVGLCSLIIIWGQLLVWLTGTSTAGLVLFQSLSQTVLFLACVLSGVVSGLSVIREKTERTLGLILLTDISCTQHIAGKLLTSNSAMVITVLSAFPLFVLSATLGGISAGQIAGAFLVLLGTIFLGCCMGLLAAAATRTERTMLSLELGLTLFLFLALPLGIGILANYEPSLQAAEQWLDVISPFLAMQAVTRGVDLAAGGRSLLFSLALGLLFLWPAQRLLPRDVLREGREPFFRSIRTRLGLVSRRRRQAAPALPASVNPVAWRDGHFRYGGPARAWAFCGLVAMPAVAAVAALIAWLAKSGAEDAVVPTLGTMGGLAAAAFALLAVVRSARAFNSEKAERTLELLLASDLSEKEIIRGKIRAIVLSVLPWLCCAAACGLLAIWIGSGGHRHRDPLLLGIGFFAFGLSNVCAFSSVALFMSLRFRTPAVLGFSFLGFLGWSWFVKSFMAMVAMIPMAMLQSMRPHSTSADSGILYGALMFLAQIVPDIGLAALFLGLLHVNFRAGALREL
jgi:ABC-type transport system involved in multi-copper enzyme maturation permease subunit